MDKAAALGVLYEEFEAVPDLQQVAHDPDGTPKILVPGRGPLDAPLVVVGEAPGAAEEMTGQPFVGPAGRELQRLFAEAGLPWDLCYRMNVLPWRPSAANRTPYPFEISISAFRVQAEITVIGPSVVIAAGAVAWQAVTAKQHGPFPGHRGKWMRWAPMGRGDFSCDLLAVFHPSALLHAPKNRRPEMEAETLAALRSVLEGARAS